VEVSLYGRQSPSIGAGAALGSDGVVALGLSCLYAFSYEDNSVYALEITALVRVYVLGFKNNKTTGLFVQFNGGPVLLSDKKDIKIPTQIGTFSLGLSAGWRFPLGNYLYIEPAIRGGYPYKVGAGVSAGIRL